MLIGIGIDVLEFSQLRQAIERSGQRLIERIFTPHEQSICHTRRDPIPGLCARFAAKEALAKALRLGIFRAGLLNMEVRNREDGSPLFSVRGSLREHLTQLGNPTIHLSMSHGRHNAVAFVIVESQLAAHNRNQSEPPMRFVRS